MIMANTTDYRTDPEYVVVGTDPQDGTIGVTVWFADDCDYIHADQLDGRAPHEVADEIADRYGIDVR